MNDKNELFPFPVFESEQPDAKTESSLPSFPESHQEQSANAGENSLNQQEIAELRSMLEWFRKSQTKSAQQAATIAELAPHAEHDITRSSPAKWLKFVTDSEDPAIAAIAAEMVELLHTIDAENASAKVSMALTGLLPVKKFLRHGTPEQQMFALTVIGDRFLATISSVAFAERKKLLKTVAKVLSIACDKFTFIQTEGEVFNPQLHERSPQSASSGRTIREMRSFLVIETISNKVIRTSQVLT